MPTKRDYVAYETSWGSLPDPRTQEEWRDNRPTPVKVITWDEKGCRLSYQLGTSVSNSFAYNGDGSILSETDTVGSTNTTRTYSYDPQGDVLSDGCTTYSYDP
jgi:hypothetical protein